MQILQSLFVWIHVIAGFIGLIAFWVPVFTRKGGVNHKRYGKAFKYSAYVLLGAATLALMFRIPQFLATDFENERDVIFLSLYVFLSYLIIITYIGLRHGFLVLEHKHDITELNTPLNNGMAVVSIVTSIFLIAFTIIISPANQIVLYALSPIGISTGLEIKTAIRNKYNYKKVWLYEHLNAMLGTGIAFHTAFAVFGASQIFNLKFDGFLQIIPWITPALIGVPATMIWTRIYKQRYGELDKVTTK